MSKKYTAVNRVSLDDFRYDMVAPPSRDEKWKREQNKIEGLRLSRKIGIHSLVQGSIKVSEEQDKNIVFTINPIKEDKRSNDKNFVPELVDQVVKNDP